MKKGGGGTAIEKHVLDTNAGKQLSYKLPQMSS